MATVFTYSVSVDTANGAVAASKLDQEVRSSAITVALSGVLVENDTLTITFKADLSVQEEIDLDALVSAHDGVPVPGGDVSSSGNIVVALERVQADGIPKVAVAPRVGSEAIYATHNFCDQTTWYSESTRVVEEALSDSGGGLVWTSTNQHWINLREGRVLDEEGIVADQAVFESSDPHGYAVLVEVSTDGGTTWTEMNQHPPFEPSGGDYGVDYTAGTITFDSTQAGNLVRASYSYESGSGWIMRPLPGKMLSIEKAEIQFSIDAQFDGDIVMEAYGLVEIFAPPLAASNGGPLPDGTPIPINETRYKTVAQLLDESVGTFAKFPALGGAARGTTQDMYILQFHYAAAKLLFSSLGMFLKLSTSSGVEWGGLRATSTFYLTSKEDPGLQQALTELGVL